MKYIPLRTTDKFNTKAVIQAVAGQAQAQGLKVDEMRKRCRILDALEKATTTGMLIEDADQEHLAKLTAEFSFAVATPELLAIIDDILNAGAPPAPMLQPAVNGAAAPEPA